MAYFRIHWFIDIWARMAARGASRGFSDSRMQDTKVLKVQNASGMALGRYGSVSLCRYLAKFDVRDKVIRSPPNPLQISWSFMLSRS